MMLNIRIFLYFLLYVFLSTTILLPGVSSNFAQTQPPTPMDKSKPVPMIYWGKSPPVREKLPLKIGHHKAKRYLNLSPVALQATSATLIAHRLEPGSFLFTFTVGSAMKFSDVYSNLFQSIESVKRLPSGIIKGPTLDGMIEEQIDDFDVKAVTFPAKTIKAEVTYRFTFYSPRGEKINSWTVKGAGEEAERPGDFNFHVFRAVDEAQHDVATKFIIGFPEVPAVRQLLQKKGY